MILTKRPQRKGAPAQCSVHGCFHSAAYRAVWLGTYSELLCAKHAATWQVTYDNALANHWPVDDKEVVAA